MPIYAYRCAACGHQKDVLQKLSDAPLTVCPSCGASAFAKQVTAAGFQLKGSGWYATDFKNSGVKSDSKPAADGAPAAGKSDGGKTDGGGSASSPAATGGSASTGGGAATSASSSAGAGTSTATAGGTASASH